jgi:DNA helicase HerA-like ATPase
MSLKLSRRRPISGSVTTETPEDLLERVAELVHERQVLRAISAGRADLERNRAEIARAQWDLSRALIVRHQR